MSVCVWRRITPSAEPFLVKFLIGVGKVYTKFWLGYYNLIREIAPPPSPLKKCPFFKNLNLKWRPDLPSPPFMCSQTLLGVGCPCICLYQKISLFGSDQANSLLKNNLQTKYQYNLIYFHAYFYRICIMFNCTYI